MRKALAIPLIVVCIICFLTWCFLFSTYWADDAFITFRVARNIINGYGMVWNPGGERIDLATSPPALALAVGSFVVGFDPLIVARVVNIIAILSAALLIFWALDWNWFGLWGAITLLLTPSVAFQGIHGLCTGLFLLSVTLAVVVAVRRMPSYIVAAACALVCVVRPEGLVVAVVVLMFYPPRPRDVLLFLVLPLLCFLVLKAVVLGGLVPNTYYFKRDSMQPLQLRSLNLFLVFFKQVAVVPLLIVALAGLTQIRMLGWREGCCLAVAACGCGLYAFFDLTMNINFRFFLPYYPVMLVAAGLAAGGLWGRGLKCTPRPFVFGMTLLALLPMQMGFMHTWEAVRFYDPIEVHEFTTMGHLLAKYQARNRKLCLDTAGMVPYLADWTVLDVQGLASRDTNIERWRTGATGFRGSRVNRDMVYAFRPDVIVFARWSNMDCYQNDAEFADFLVVDRADFYATLAIRSDCSFRDDLAADYLAMALPLKAPSMVAACLCPILGGWYRPVVNVLGSIF